MEEERWKCRMKGIEEMRNCMEEYRAKCERNDRWMKMLLIMEEER